MILAKTFATFALSLGAVVSTSEPSFMSPVQEESCSLDPYADGYF